MHSPHFCKSLVLIYLSLSRRFFGDDTSQLPHPIDWKEFAQRLNVALAETPPTYDVLSKEFHPWIRLKRLKVIFKGKSHEKCSIM